MAGVALALVLAGGGFVLAACTPAGPFLHLTASAHAAVVGPGQTATSTITATSTGTDPTAATTVHLVYTRPGGAVGISFSVAPGVTCSFVNPRYGSPSATCNVPALAPGGSFAIATMTVTAPASVPYGGLSASISATGPNDSASSSFPIRGSGPANLVSSAYVTPSVDMVSRPVTASVTISDLGYTPANDFRTVVTAPPGSLIGAVTSTAAATTCTTADNVVTCITPVLSNGASLGLTVPFTTPPDAGLDAVTVDTDADAVVPETSEADNATSASIDVRAVAAGVVPSVSNPPSVPTGSLFTRAITVTNTGGATATAVSLADRFATIGYVDATGPAGTSCSLATSYSGRPPTIHKLGANCTLGDLAPGEAKTVFLRLSVAGTVAAGTYTDTVTASTTAYSDSLVVTSTTASTVVEVLPTPLPPTNLAAPAFTGNLNTGSVVTGTGGSWLSVGTPVLGYQWQRCTVADVCTDIVGEVGTTHTVQVDDVGFNLAFVVTATNAGGSTTISSARLGPVVAAVKPSIAVAPALQPGLEKQPTFAWGVSTGTWSGTPTITFAYQWRRCAINGGSCIDIAGATSNSYVLQTDDVFHSVQVLVTATNTAGSASALSNLSGEIDPYG